MTLGASRVAEVRSSRFLVERVNLLGCVESWERRGPSLEAAEPSNRVRSETGQEGSSIDNEEGGGRETKDSQLNSQDPDLRVRRKQTSDERPNSLRSEEDQLEGESLRKCSLSLASVRRSVGGGGGTGGADVGEELGGEESLEKTKGKDGSRVRGGRSDLGGEEGGEPLEDEEKEGRRKVSERMTRRRGEMGREGRTREEDVRRADPWTSRASSRRKR